MAGGLEAAALQPLPPAPVQSHVRLQVQRALRPPPRERAIAPLQTPRHEPRGPPPHRRRRPTACTPPPPPHRHPASPLTPSPSPHQDRISAKDALDHDYFWEAPFPARPEELPKYTLSSHEFTAKKRRQAAATNPQPAAAAAASAAAPPPQRGGPPPGHHAPPPHYAQQPPPGYRRPTRTTPGRRSTPTAAARPAARPAGRRPAVRQTPPRRRTGGGRVSRAPSPHSRARYAPAVAVPIGFGLRHARGRRLPQRLQGGGGGPPPYNPRPHNGGPPPYNPNGRGGGRRRVQPGAAPPARPPPARPRRRRRPRRLAALKPPAKTFGPADHLLYPPAPPLALFRRLQTTRTTFRPPKKSADTRTPPHAPA